MLKNNCFSPVQHCYCRTDGQIYIGGIKSHKYSSNRCLVDSGSGVDPGLYDCKLAEQKKFHMLWDFKQVSNMSVLRTETEIESRNEYIKALSTQKALLARMSVIIWETYLKTSDPYWWKTRMQKP